MSTVKAPPDTDAHNIANAAGLALTASLKVESIMLLTGMAKEGAQAMKDDAKNRLMILNRRVAIAHGRA